jgi:hypothetical protein
VATSVPARDIELVRGFNRLVTRRLGTLDDPYLGKRPLGECRVLYEIGLEGATARDVRARLGLDPAYLAGLVRALERDGLVRESEARPVRRPRAYGSRPPAIRCCASWTVTRTSSRRRCWRRSAQPSENA